MVSNMARTLSSSEPTCAQYSANSSAGLLAATWTLETFPDPVLVKSEWIWISSAFGRASMMSSRRPAYVDYLTRTRSQSSPYSSAAARSCSTAPSTVRSRRADFSGRSVTFAGVPGEASTSRTVGVFSSSPKSTASGEPD